MSGNPAIGLFDDFVGFGHTATAGSQLAYFTSNGISYMAYENDDGSIGAAVPTTTPSVSANGPGVISLTAGNTDNDDTSIQAGGATMMPFNVIPGTAKDLVFECRWKYSSIAASCTDFFIGLFGTGGAADNGWLGDNPSGTIASDVANNNMLGFSRLTSTGTSSLLLIYDRVGGTTGTHATAIDTLVADTYVKSGFRYNAAAQTLDVYADGVYVTRVTKATINATPWPSLYMNFLAGVKYQATTQDVMYIDWWACAQYV
ncbi:MAG TPA: hypothetical protein VM223_00240 [Planctomycetota bacterium]|nr:hypothetical protein [Planctomycetota bacterium]